MSKVIQPPIQKILFGSPGTGKSYRIDRTIIPNQLDIDKEKNPENIVKTVFHPEYTYGDFMGKLVPMTKSGKVEYNFYEGHFLKAIAQAYKNILSAKEGENPKNVALVIDEINRGNSSAIFGTTFQLLDRDEDGWSSYGISVSQLELHKLLLLIGFDDDGHSTFGYYKYGRSKNPKALEEYKEVLSKLRISVDSLAVIGNSMHIPPNLSILATMNTSDNSIYFMDSAFKRRWDWEFINWDGNSDSPEPTYGTEGTLIEEDWKKLIQNLNSFIKKHHASIRGIEDKQIGYFFIKQPVTAQQIQNKLMFFLWDSVFNRDKKPLADILNVTRDQLVTFGDFTKLHNEFVKKIMDLNK